MSIAVGQRQPTGASEGQAHGARIEEAWRVTQPLLDGPPPVHGYTEGS